MPEKHQKRVVYLSVPESLRGRMENEAGDGGSGFFIDPAIPIPAEIPEGEENLNLEELSWEMIISGMLHVISGGPGTSESPVKSEWADYYRRFVLAVRPAIMGELTEAAILKARNGDFDLALEILGALRGLFPSSPVVKVNRALVMEERAAHMEKRGRAEAGEAFSAAESAYDEALAAEPPFPGAFLNAGFFCLNRKDFRRAREYFERYTEIAEDGDKKEQAQEIVRDIDRSGLEDECYSEACELIRQGKDEEGMLRIRGFIEKRPDVWNGWFVLGWALRRLGRWEDGAAALGKAVECGGSGGDIRNELAICLMELGDLKGARRELETALRDDPENVKIISNLGVLAMKNGKSGEAAAFFRAVLELDPEDPIAKKWAEGGSS